MDQKPWYQPILEWLERVAPGLLASFGIGYQIGIRKANALEAQLQESELEKEKLKNEIAVQKDFNGKSAADIIHDAARKGADGSKPKS